MLKVKQVAAQLEISVSIVYDWIAKGKLACYRFGSKGRGAIRIAETDLAAWIESLKTQKEQPAVKPIAPKKNQIFKHLNAEKLLQAWRDA